MSSQITTFLVCLFTLCASVLLLSAVGEHMVLQNSISTNDFSHSEQGWGFSPVCIIGLAMRLRIHAVHADDPHMRICASRCACKNLDAHQPHIEQKRVLQRQICSQCNKSFSQAGNLLLPASHRRETTPMCTMQLFSQSGCQSERAH